MKKHRLREALQSFFEPHFDHEKGEMLKRTKTEIDEKVTKILGIVESGDIVEDESKRQVVAELVNEFYNEYQSLYRQYDDLTGEIRNKVNGKGETSSSSSSDSDSDHSSKRKTKRNGKGKVESVTGALKQQIETVNLEIADPKGKLTTTIEEKEAADSELEVALMKLKESEEIINKLKLETEKLEDAKTTALSYNRELHQKLDDAGKTENDLKQKLEDVKRERDELKTERDNGNKRFQEAEKVAEDREATSDQLKDEASNFEQQLEASEQRVSELTSGMNSAEEVNKSSEQRVSDLSVSLKDAEEENKAISSKNLETMEKLEQAQNTIKELREELGALKGQHKEKECELSSVVGVHEAYQRDSTSRVEELVAVVQSADKKVADMKQSLDNTEKEKKLLSQRIPEISNEIQEAKKSTQELMSESEQLKESHGVKERELSCLRGIHETHQRESSTRLSELETQLKSSEQRAVDLSTSLHAAEKENKSISSKILETTDELKQAQSKVQELLTELAESKDTHIQKESELSSLVEVHEAHKRDSSSQVKELEARVESAEKLVEELNQRLNSSEEEKKLLSQRISEMSTEIKRAESTIQELMSESEQLKRSYTEKDNELFSLRNIHENHQRESSTQLRDLEAQLKSSEQGVSELSESLKAAEEESKTMSMKISKTSDELEQAQIMVKELTADSSKLKEQLAEKEGELLLLPEKDRKSQVQIKELEATAVTLERELESARSRIIDLEKDIGSKTTAVEQLEALNREMVANRDPLHSSENSLLGIKTQQASVNVLDTDLSIPELVMGVMETDPAMEIGGFKVYKGTRDNRDVAIKKIPLSKLAFKIAKNERTIHHACENESRNIVRLYGVDVLEGFIYICFQPWECTLGDLVKFCSRGESESLYKNQEVFLKKFKHKNVLWDSRRPSSLLCKLIREAVIGVSDLHGYGIVHRNINESSFFIISKGENVTLKLGDLSMGKLDQDSEALEKQIRYAPEQTQKKNKVEGLTNDIFFLGCVVGYSISGGQHIFKDEFDGSTNLDPMYNEPAMNIVRKSSEGYYLVKNLIKRPHTERLTAESMLTQPFFWSNTKKVAFYERASERFMGTVNNAFWKSVYKSKAIVMGVDDWHIRLHQNLRTAANKVNSKRKDYQTHHFTDLVRFVRNTLAHVGTNHPDVETVVGDTIDSVLEYFANMYPDLLVEVHKIVFNNFRKEKNFVFYFTDKGTA
ncbi:COP1-interactive protein 1 [Capsella rubella]|nr:COP1-interactive protein 1 [Capsella rubella]XP_023635027.1 COP1-interactive protein 1 [Capsella rubella]XP_023635028.1 COP1-interactive protein 1 [Capsella rubella]XP_023635029.1 COP1-interactive protein 1 [Capsella rubella]XP_023635030.1 COP1-interactive protein 1 [Capsella rubella]XP_023635031.1 COP1-interactive protein 1 [Capsella rubella]